MSGYSLSRQIIPTDSSVNIPLPNIVANQRTQIAVIAANTFQPFLRVNNPSSVEVASGEVITTFTPIVGGTFTGIVTDKRGAATALTPYTVEVNLEPNNLNNQSNGDTPAVNPGTYSGWVGSIDTLDSYRIDGSDRGKLTATLGNLDGIVNVDLVDSSTGFSVATTQNNKGQPDAKLEFEVLTPGKRYFLEVKYNFAASGSGEGSGKNNSSQYTLNLAFPTSTQPPVTQPPVTQPPVTQPPVTQPPVTQPPVTQPPVTQPVGTPVAIAAPAINAPAPGNPTGQPANSVNGQFYNLSDSNDNIVLSSLPPAAAGKQILALSGGDNITGTSGIDNINGMQGADTIDGGAGNDVLSGGKESDEIDGGAGDDQIFANNDNDTLTGGEGNDNIRGGKENDVLIGGNGDDLLGGDRGQDILTGNGGRDTFILAGGQAAATRLVDADVVVDFNGDLIGLTDGNTFASLTFEAVSLTLNGGSAVSATAIKLGTNYLGIVQGVAQSQLTANVFVNV
jgi:Ca2+-binding RTX toxin-like protein